MKDFPPQDSWPENFVIQEISDLVTLRGPKGLRRGKDLKEIAPLPNGYLIIEKGKISEIGQGLPPKTPLPTFSGQGKTIMPGFVDSHTHLAFSGYRADEFEMRAEGALYMDILKAGGGIHQSVKKCRETSEEELFSISMERIKKFISFGTTAIEIKSGYGLDQPNELKQLRVMEKIKKNSPLDIKSTFLGAHALPKEFNQGSLYLEFLSKELLPEIKKKGLADFVDIFCEKGIFELNESECYLREAKKMGFPLRIHADEIASLGGGELGCRLSANSVDHLIHITESGIKALGESNTLACFLPGTSFSLREDFAPARKIIERGGAPGLATDCNPGSSCTENMQLILQLACNLLKMSMAECLNAAIYNNAWSLGISAWTGSLEQGKNGDFLIFDFPRHPYLFYHYGINHLQQVFKKGKCIFSI